MQDGMHDAMRLLEELRIYQTELEIQNQDLRAAQNVAEEALRKYKWLFENMPLHGLIVDGQGFVVEGNALAREQFGLREQTALQRRSVYQLFSLESRTGLHAALSGNAVPGEAIQCHFEFRDAAQPQYSEAYVLSLPDVEESRGYRLILLVDRTAEQSLQVKQRALLQTQESLITERNRLNNVLEGTRAATWEWEVHSRDIDVNARWKELLGYGPSDFVHLTLDTKWELSHPDDVRTAQSRLTSHLAGRLDFYECEIRMRHKSGHWIWTIDRARVVQKDERGRPLRVAGTQMDVTESVDLRLQMEASLALLSNLTRQLQGSLYQFRQFPDGRSCFPYASDGFRDLCGVSPGEVRDDASKVFSRVHTDDLQRVMETIAESARTLRPWICEFRINFPGAGIRWIGGNSKPERTADGGTLWHGYMSDITVHKEAH
jgi:PAS domain S-box-containing protein